MFQPVAIREMRVSARHKATHRLRMAVAVGAVALACLIGLFSGLTNRATGGMSGLQMGSSIFETLRWIAFILTCLAGTFLTADCLSEEKREGTLGLLFLTDLRGRDVVLGKLLATSLRASFSLLAIFPVMACSFCLGGVSSGLFWQTILALVNALFFSVALGILVSAGSRNALKAMTGALTSMSLCLWLCYANFPLLGNATPALDLFSPAFAFLCAGRYPTGPFWWSLALVHLSAWACLALASWMAPRTWQDRPSRTVATKPGSLDLVARAVGGPAGRKLRDQHPLGWLIARDRWGANVVWVLTLLAVAAFVLGLLTLNWNSLGSAAAPAPIVTTRTITTTTNGNVTSTTVYTSSSGSLAVATFARAMSRMSSNLLFGLSTTFASLLSLALELWIAALICRFYIEARRNGFLELLWVTPAKPADIVEGQWRAMRHLFLKPAITLACLTVIGAAIQSLSTSAALSSLPTGPAGLLSVDWIQLTASAALDRINWCIGLCTLVWFSMWMSLTSTRMTTALLKTFVFAKFLPFIALAFLGGILSLLLIFTSISTLGISSLLVGQLLSPILFIGANIALIQLGRRNAQRALVNWMEAAHR